MTIEYLEELKKIPLVSDFGGMFRYQSFNYPYDKGGFKEYRKELVVKYAWAIPNETALYRISQFTKSICEIGAGTGYWAYLLSQQGIDIVAYDLKVPSVHDNEYGHTEKYFDVKHGDVLSITQHQNRALMLCWPPYANTMSDVVLSLYTGKKVIYIGEDQYGCTGCEEFHNRLNNEFKIVDTVDIPNWDGIRDYLHLYERR